MSILVFYNVYGAGPNAKSTKKKPRSVEEASKTYKGNLYIREKNIQGQDIKNSKGDYIYKSLGFYIQNYN